MRSTDLIYDVGNYWRKVRFYTRDRGNSGALVGHKLERARDIFLLFFLHSFRRHSATGKQRERIDNLGINTREGENLATRFPFRPSRYSIYVRKNPRIVAAERFLFFFLSFLFFFLIQSIYAFSRSKFNLRADPWPRVLNTENRWRRTRRGSIRVGI